MIQYKIKIPNELDSPHQNYFFESLLRGRLRQGRRESYVKWEDGTKTWEPDASFSPKQLAHINAKFTIKVLLVLKSCKYPCFDI